MLVIHEKSFLDKKITETEKNNIIKKEEAGKIEMKLALFRFFLVSTVLSGKVIT